MFYYQLHEANENLRVKELLLQFLGSTPPPSCVEDVKEPYGYVYHEVTHEPTGPSFEGLIQTTMMLSSKRLEQEGEPLRRFKESVASLVERVGMILHQVRSLAEASLESNETHEELKNLEDEEHEVF